MTMPELTLPKDLTVVSGSISPIGWMTSEVALSMAPQRSSGVLRLSMTCSDSDVAMSGGSISIMINDAISDIHNLTLGEEITVELHIEPSSSPIVKIQHTLDGKQSTLRAVQMKEIELVSGT
jgi:hypothetical protein